MSKIIEVKALEILDSRGNPTLEVKVIAESGAIGVAAVPSGASTGAHEACELRDEDEERFHGKGVLKAIQNVEDDLSEVLCDLEVTDQHEIDLEMLTLDGTANKQKLGANAILGCSLAAAHCGAKEKGLPLFRYVGGLNVLATMPFPLMNLINGGAHADNGLNVQEFMIAPQFDNIRENVQAGSEVFHTLKKILKKRNLSTGVGDEGGFAPTLRNNEEALQLLVEAIEQSGYEPGEEIQISLDVAATELFKNGKYSWQNEKLSGKELLSIYQDWMKKYPILSIEDGFSEDDWDSWKLAVETAGEMIWVGDDLFVTNPDRLVRGVSENAANALLVKPNQIGTLSETMTAVQLAHRSGFAAIMSHRSGETEDTTISHLAVGLGCEFIKTGSVCRGERTAKYNELLRIEAFRDANY